MQARRHKVNPMARKSFTSKVPTFILRIRSEVGRYLYIKFCRLVTGLMQIAHTIHAIVQLVSPSLIRANSRPGTTYSALIASASCLALSNMRFSSSSLPRYAFCTCRSNLACASSAANLSISSTSAALGCTGLAPVFATNCFQMSSAKTSFKLILTAVSPFLASGAGVVPSVDEAMCCHGSEPDTVFLGAFSPSPSPDSPDSLAISCSPPEGFAVLVVELADDDWLSWWWRWSPVT